MTAVGAIGERAPTRMRSHTGAFIANVSSPIRNDEAPRVSSNHGSATC